MISVRADPLTLLATLALSAHPAHAGPNEHPNPPRIAAMMNNDNSIPYYPAAYDETIAIGSTDRYDERSSFSSYGDHIDLCAPGSYIWSTLWNDTYAAWDGTSMATPHGSGTVALLLAREPWLDVELLRARLRDTAEDQVGRPGEDTPGWDRYHGAARLNAHAPLAAGDACALALTILDSPASVAPGEDLVILGELRNDCDDPREFDLVLLDATGPATTSNTLYEGAARPIAAGTALRREVVLRVPLGAPLGEYDLSLSASLRGIDLASASFPVRVE